MNTKAFIATTSRKGAKSFKDNTEVPGFKRHHLSQAIGLMFTVTVFSGAVAQTAPDGKAQRVEEVVITGSNIRGVAPVGSPVTAIGQDAIVKTGLSTTFDVLKTLPAVTSIGTDESNLRNSAQTGGLNVSFGSGVNLRALGSSSTLTLFNGYRVAPSGQRGWFFDASAIAPNSIERLEVVPDGASAVYGSDAVGGVVNMLIRRNYEGAETSLRYGKSQSGTTTKDFSQIYGKGWDTGSFMVAFNHNERSAFLATDVPNLFNDDQRAYGGTDLRSNNAAAGNIVVGANYYPILHAADGTATGLGAAGASSSSLINKQSNWLGFNALPRQRREAVTLAFNQELSERIQFFALGFASNRAFRQQNAAQTPGATVAVPLTNPYFNAALRPATLAPTATTVNVAYSFINDLGPTVQTGGSEAHALIGGFKLDVGHDWNAEVFASHSYDRDDRLSTGVNTCAISDPGPGAAAHRAACGNTTGVLYDLNPATTLNVFGGGGNNNQATLSKIIGWSLFHSDYRLTGTGAKADGPIFDLPAGKVRLASGVEYYKHNQQNRTPNTTASANVSTALEAPIQHQYRSVKAFYVEAFIPVIGAVNALPGVQKLDFSIAGRAEKYSDFGSTKNPKVSFNWVPVKDFTVHGTYGRSFRAPTLADANIDGTVGINVQNFTEINGTQTQGLNLVGGNPALTPEKAKTYSIGLDFRPSGLKGFDASLNYFNVVYTNRIGTPAAGLSGSFAQESLYAQYITRRPANPATVLTSGFCSGLTFNACVQGQMNRVFYNNALNDPNQIQFIIDGRAQNAGSLNTDGFDLQAHYRWNTDIGQWTAGAAMTYITSFRQSTVVGGLVTDQVNTVDNPLRYHVRADLGWNQGNYRANLFVNYNNGYSNLTVSPKQAVASYTTVDASLGYDTGEAQGQGWLKNVRVSLDVQNLFDNDPSFARVGNQLFDPSTGSALGRSVSVQVTKKWW